MSRLVNLLTYNDFVQSPNFSLPFRRASRSENTLRVWILNESETSVYFCFPALIKRVLRYFGC